MDLQNYIQERLREIEMNNLETAIAKLTNMHLNEVISKRRRNSLGRILKASQEKLAAMKVG